MSTSFDPPPAGDSRDGAPATAPDGDTRLETVTPDRHTSWPGRRRPTAA